VYTRESDEANASRCNCVETVRYVGLEKNSGREGDDDGGGELQASVVMRKASPAPSQSFDVSIGGCTSANWWPLIIRRGTPSPSHKGIDRAPLGRRSVTAELKYKKRVGGARVT
jgi:hypothetical protein